jgi:sec-independent protein translocase protein TatA
MIPGGWEWIVIILVIVVLFGAKRIPEMGKSLGQGIRGFKKELRGEENGENESEKSEKSNDTSEKP